MNVNECYWGQITESLRRPTRKPGWICCPGRGQCLRGARGNNTVSRRGLSRACSLPPWTKFGSNRSHFYLFIFLTPALVSPAPRSRQPPHLKSGGLGSLRATRASPTPSLDTSFPAPAIQFGLQDLLASRFPYTSQSVPSLTSFLRKKHDPCRPPLPRPNLLGWSWSRRVPYSGPSRRCPRFRGRGHHANQCACADLPRVA